jgi:hypothetical protein
MYRSFPLVAAQFQFHSMWMCASAAAGIHDDVDGQHDLNDPDKRTLTGAVGLFYERLADLHQPEDVFPLLSKLVSRDYAISLLSHCEVHRLYRLFESLLAVSSIDNREYDTVHESLEIVKRFFSGGKPRNDC